MKKEFFAFELKMFGVDDELFHNFSEPKTVRRIQCE